MNAAYSTATATQKDTHTESWPIGYAASAFI